VEKILNKRKVRGVDKYLVRWKDFTMENDTWEKKEYSENTKELVNKFEGRLEIECHKLHLACIFTTSGPIFTN